MARNGIATAMLREFWPVVRVLRREGLSWRRLPKHMHESYGVPLVSHVNYIIVAREMGDVRYTRRK